MCRPPCRVDRVGRGSALHLGHGIWQVRCLYQEEPEVLGEPGSLSNKGHHTSRGDSRAESQRQREIPTPDPAGQKSKHGGQAGEPMTARLIGTTPPAPPDLTGTAADQDLPSADQTRELPVSSGEQVRGRELRREGDPWWKIQEALRRTRSHHAHGPQRPRGPMVSGQRCGHRPRRRAGGPSGSGCRGGTGLPRAQSMTCPEVSLTRRWVQLCRDCSLAFYFGPE